MENKSSSSDLLSSDDGLLVSIETEYIPSSVERKRGMMMYIVLGIFIMFFRKELSTYELYHLKQSLGWWFIVILFFVFSFIFVFLPFFRWLVFFGGLGLIIIRGFMVKQARQGKIIVNNEIKRQTSRQKMFFEILGNWICTIFDIRFVIKNG